MEHEKLLETVVELEWRQFTVVNNQGGRASCQDDRSTFDVMRKSQFLAWPLSLLESYCKDLEDAEASGWNLPAEKYARMMESTAPQEYLALKDRLPLRSEERLHQQEEVIARQMAWLEETQSRYPHLGGIGRPVRTEQDTCYVTSVETYLRGELGSYSDRTFALYFEFVKELAAQGKNLSEITLENTARLYGYDGLDSI